PAEASEAPFRWASDLVAHARKAQSHEIVIMHGDHRGLHEICGWKLSERSLWSRDNLLFFIPSPGDHPAEYYKLLIASTSGHKPRTAIYLDRESKIRREDCPNAFLPNHPNLEVIHTAPICGSCLYSC